MGPTKIDWCDAVWNPVTGCTPAGAGCQHCYAKGIAHRFWGDRPFSDVRCHPERLDQPMNWNKPQAVFVNSMGDLFHEDVPFEFVDRVLSIMSHANKHIYVVLTKRPARMRKYFQGLASGDHRERLFSNPDYAHSMHGFALHYRRGYSLENLILGCSPCNQSECDRWIPELLATPASRRILSIEPMVEAIDLFGGTYGPNFLTGFDTEEVQDGEDRYCREVTGNSLDGVIVGGETGHNARPLHPDWVRSIRNQCAASGVSFFFKQWGEWKPISEPWKQDDIEKLAAGERWLNLASGHGFHGEKLWRMRRLGKNRSGRLLDGRTHDDLCWEVSR